MALRPQSCGQAGHKPSSVSAMLCVTLWRSQGPAGHDATEARRCKQEVGPDSLQLLEVTQRLSRLGLGPPCSCSGTEPALGGRGDAQDTLIIKKAMGRGRRPTDAEQEQRAHRQSIGVRGPVLNSGGWAGDGTGSVMGPRQAWVPELPLGR